MTPLRARSRTFFSAEALIGLFTLSFNRASVDMHNYRRFIDTIILA